MKLDICILIFKLYGHMVMRSIKLICILTNFKNIDALFDYKYYNFLIIG